jgi:hypothetical protein
MPPCVNYYLYDAQCSWNLYVISPKGYAMKTWLTNGRRKLGVFAAISVPMLLVGSMSVVAQIEGPKRGIPAIASTGDFEVTGIRVEATGDTAEEAQRAGWEEAQRLAWSKLWARNHGGAKGSLSDSTLNGIVSAIIVEEEQLGPKRYIATLGVVFDRARAGQLLGVKGITRRSAPLMILPIMWDGGTPVVYEQRNVWQNTWAKFSTADSRIDYVRPSGAGSESLLLNAGQIERRSRNWWRTILDQFGAADVIIPIVRLDRQYPGGPVTGQFTARYGPDNKFIGSFALRAQNSAGIPAMLRDGVVKMDALFQEALAAGRLRADSSLVLEQTVVEEEDLEDIAPVVSVSETEQRRTSAGGRRLPTESLDVLDRAVNDVTNGNTVTPLPSTPIEPPKPVIAPPPTAVVSEKEQKALEKQKRKEEKEREKQEKKQRKEEERRLKEERKRAEGN